MKTTMKRFLAGCLAAVMLLSTGAFAAEPAEEGESLPIVAETHLGQPGEDQPKPSTDGSSAGFNVNSVNFLTNAAPAAETGDGPVYDSTNKKFYANGVHITISAPTSGDGAKVTWDGGSEVITADTTVFGGSKDNPVSSTWVTMTDGTVKSIYGGGCNSTATVDETSVSFSGGNVSWIYGGGMDATTKTAAVEISGGTVAQNAYAGGWGATVDTASITVSGGTIGTMSITASGVTGQGAVFAGGFKGQVTNRTVTVTGGSIPMVYGGNKEMDSAGTVNMYLRGGKILTALGGSATKKGEGSFNIHVSGESAEMAAWIMQLVLGEEGEGSSPLVKLEMTGGRVDAMYASHCSADSTRVVKGGNILQAGVNAYANGAKFVDGNGNPVYQVHVLTSTGDRDLSTMVAALPSTHAAAPGTGKAFLARVTTNNTHWYSSLGDDGHLDVYLPAGSLPAGKLIVGLENNEKNQFASCQNKDTMVQAGNDLTSVFVYPRTQALVTYGAKDGGGSVNANSGTVTNAYVDIGQSVTFTATADPDYAFEAWWINGVKSTTATTNTLSHTITGDTDVRASFVKQGEIKFGGSEMSEGGRSCKVTATVGGGTPSASTESTLGTTNATVGTEVSFSHDTPSNDYAFLVWREYDASGNPIKELGNANPLVWTSEGEGRTIIAECVNKDALEGLIDKAGPMNSELNLGVGSNNYDVTDAQKTNFTEKYNAALTVRDDPKAFQSAIDQAKTDLENAMAQIKCKVIFSPASVTGGSFTLNGGPHFGKDAPVTITPESQTGYYYNENAATTTETKLKAAAGTENIPLTWNGTNYTFTMPSSVVTITIHTDPFLANGHTVTIDTATNGSLTATLDEANFTTGGQVKYTQTLVFTAEPEANFEVDEWKILKTGTEENATDIGKPVYGEGRKTLTLKDVDEDITVRVSFKRCQNKITISTEGPGTVTIDQNSGVVLAEGGSYYFGKAGEEVKVEVSSNENYRLEGITFTKTVESNNVTEDLVKDTSVTNKLVYKFTMPNEETTIKAKFAQLYKIEIANSEIENSGGVPDQTKVTIALKVAGQTESAPFKSKAGDTVIVTPTLEGYTPSKVVVTGSDGAEIEVKKQESGKFEFTMPAQNVTIKVTFTPDPHKIEWKVIKEGETPETNHGTIELNEKRGTGETVTFTVMPDAGYELIGSDPVKVSEKISGNVVPHTVEGETYSFTMPNDDVTITAKVTEASFDITSKVFGVKEDGVTKVDHNRFGKIEITTPAPASPLKAKYNSNVEFTVTANPGYEVKAVKYALGSEETPITQADGKYKFTMPAGNVEIRAEFVAAEYKLEYTEGQTNGKIKSVSPTMVKYADPVDSSDATVQSISGETEITVEVEPTKDFVLESITLTHKDDATKQTIYKPLAEETNQLKPVAGQANKYTLSYAMPAEDVTVTAQFTADMRTVTAVTDKGTETNPTKRGSISVECVDGTEITGAPSTEPEGTAYEIQTGKQLKITVKSETGQQLNGLQIDKSYKDGTAPSSETVYWQNGGDEWDDNSVGTVPEGSSNWVWVDEHVYTGLTLTENIASVTITAVYREPEDIKYTVKTEPTGNQTDGATVGLYAESVREDTEIKGPVAANTRVIVVPKSTSGAVFTVSAAVEVKKSDGADSDGTIEIKAINGHSHTFVMPSGDVTVTVAFNKEATDPPVIPVTPGNDGVTSTDVGNTRTMSYSLRSMEKALNAVNSSPDTNTVQLTALKTNSSGGTGTKDIDNTVFELYASSVAALADNEKVDGLALTGAADKQGAAAKLSLDAAALRAVKAAIPENSKDKKVEIILAKTDDISKLSEEDKAKVGDRPAYSFEVRVDGQKVSKFNNGELTLRIPYKLGEGETADNIKGCYIADKGKVQILLDSDYDAATGEMVIHTKHLSSYGLVCIENKFKDLEGHWAKSYVLPMSAMGLVKGTGKNSFSPDTPLTRGMMVTILGRWAGVDESPVSDTGFADVAPDRYYAPYVAWAKDAGVVNGTGKDTFSPEEPITRQELAVIMYRYARMQGKLELSASAPAKPFADKTSISSWAGDAVNALYNAKIINGKGADCFAPLDKASRAEVCTMLSRFIKLVETAQ